MRPASANTRMLKGLLLLALLANFSWRPVLRSLNLSSETVGAAAPLPAPPAPALVAPAAPAVPAPTSPATTAPPAAADSQDQTSGTKPPRIELPSICGMRFYVTYSEKTMSDNSLRTVAKIELHTGELSNFKPILYQFQGGFAQNLDNADVKKDDDNAIALVVKRHISNCSDDVSGPPTNFSTTNNNGQAVNFDKDLAKKDKEDIKTGMSACRLDSKGDPLTEVKQTRCQLDKLSGLDTGKDDYSGRMNVMNKIEQVVNSSLKKSIKNRLMCKDESKVDEGEELLQETIDQINDLTSSLGLDSSRMSRMVMNLQSLRSGGETYRRATALEDEVKDERNSLHDQLLQATLDAQASPGSVAAQYQLMQVKAQITQQEQQLMLQTQMQLGQPYNQLVVANRLGYLPATEFSQFVQPYNQLQADITSMLNPNQLLYGNTFPQLGSIGALGSLAPQIPANFLQVRTGLANNVPVTYNTTNPYLNSGVLNVGLGMTPVTTLTTGQVAPLGLGNLGNLGRTYTPTPLPSGILLGPAPQ